MRRILVCILEFCFLVFWCANLQAGRAAQASAISELRSQANAAYEVKDWAAAAALYGKISEAEPKNARALFRLGVARHGLGEQEKAIASYQESLEAGLPAPFGEFALGAAYASLKDKEKAFEFLQKAAVDGFSQPEELATGPEFNELRKDARFAMILDQVKKNQKPCAHTAENRQFDFWVGEWNVVTTQGEMPAGTSKIELILGDCVIQENWTSSGNVGYTGKSYNIYNAALKRWEQYWVDNAAGNIFFYGQLKDGVLDYWTGEIPQPDGTKLKRHLQFIPEGTNKVRQFSQGSTDGGKTWNVEYDFTYNRTR
jgi:tetratricopeptide (TPR) repeat protein